MKVAIIHDWLTVYAGAEKVLEQMLKVFPDADIFSIVEFFPNKESSFLKNSKITTSFIQKLPFAKTKYRNYLPLMPLAIEQFDLSAYDLIISSSHAVAKGVITGPDQIHICMCYSPIRYAWDLQHQYLKESRLDRGVKGLIAKYMLHKIRIWDLRTVNSVDNFIAISNFIAKRIYKIYKRDSFVIYPPVNTNSFELCDVKEDFYLTASRMVPYKKIDLIVEAFAKMPDKKLIVIGDGPDFLKIKTKSANNITLLGYQKFEVLKDHMQRAKAFVFAAEEDFGIAPLEAGACGTPVIAYGKGGSLETVKENVSGVFFKEQNTDSIIKTVLEFEKMSFDYSAVRQNALKFSEERFLQEFKNYINSIVDSK